MSHVSKWQGQYEGTETLEVNANLARPEGVPEDTWRGR
jgi:hypothetical protein